MTWGNWGKNLNTNEIIERLHVCLENHITTFDHADIYGGYTTEESFGKAFAESRIERDQIELISKCGIKYVTKNRNYGIKHYDYSAEYIIWCVENSLKNLKTDYLDVLLLHRPSPLMQTDEIAKTIEILKKEGKIKSFGVSNFTPLQMQLVQKNIKIDYNQIQFSVTHYEAMTNGNLDYMQIYDIIPMAWNPLGTIFKEKNAQTERLNEVLTLLSKKYNVSTDVLALAWILKHPARILPVIGTTNCDRIKNNVKALELDLDLEDWFYIWSTSMGKKVL